MSDADPTRTALLRALDMQRAHVTGAVEGLDSEAMRRPVLPSGWSCVGLIRHLTLDVERFWFRVVLTGDIPFVDTGPQWDVPDSIDPGTVIEEYVAECSAADAAIGSMTLDAVPLAWPDGLFGSWRLDDLRHMLLHVITETATHAGHLDAARELIDGTQWIVDDS